MSSLANLVEHVTDKLIMHTRCAEQWDVDVRSVQPMLQCKTYVDFVLEVAGSNMLDIAACIAVIIPHVRLYALIGHQLHRRQQQKATEGGTSAGTHQDCMYSVAHAGDEALAATLEGLLDTYGTPDQARCSFFPMLTEAEPLEAIAADADLARCSPHVSSSCRAYCDVAGLHAAGPVRQSAAFAT